MAITATAPRLMPTITHRIKLGIYRSFKACQILFIVSWACAVLFCHIIYRLGHCNICNVAYILSTVILICSTARLKLCRLGTLSIFYSNHDVVSECPNFFGVSRILSASSKLRPDRTYVDLSVNCTLRTFL